MCVCESENKDKMDSSIESPSPPPPPHLAELIQTLDAATQMAKQLPTATHPTHHHLIFTALNSAHLALSSFLSTHYHPASSPTPPAENSVSSSAVGGGGGGAGEPMQVADEYDAVGTGGGRGVGDDGEEEMNSKDSSMDRVEEKMRNFNIQNKRSKRPLSPASAAVEERLPRVDEREVEERVGSAADFGASRDSNLRSLELIYQFYS